MNELEPIEPLKRPRVWPSFVTLVLALVAILVSGAALGVFVIVQPGSQGASPSELLSTPSFLLVAAAVSQLCLLAAVWSLPRLFRDVGAHGWFERVRWRPARFSVLDVLVCAVGTQAIGAAALSVLTLLQVKGGLLESMGGAARATSPAQFAGLLLFGAIAPGFAEELTFRGLLQTRLVERWGSVVGVLVSAVMFGLWHLDVRQGLMAMTMGVWLGWCAQRHQSIVNVAFAHVVNNAFAFTLSRFGDEQQEHGEPWPTIAVSLVLVALCAVVIERRSRNSLTPDSPSSARERAY